MGLINISAFSGMDDFWWSHWNDHLEIVQAINKAHGLNLPTYNIYPWSEADKAGILERHQQYHFDMDGAIGTQSQEMTEVDFEDASKRNAWVFTNYQPHLAAHTILGI